MDGSGALSPDSLFDRLGCCTVLTSDASGEENDLRLRFEGARSGAFAVAGGCSDSMGGFGSGCFARARLNMNPLSSSSYARDMLARSLADCRNSWAWKWVLRSKSKPEKISQRSERLHCFFLPPAAPLICPLTCFASRPASLPSSIFDRLAGGSSSSSNTFRALLRRDGRCEDAILRDCSGGRGSNVVIDGVELARVGSLAGESVAGECGAAEPMLRTKRPTDERVLL